MFQDRVEAGRILASAIEGYDLTAPLVLAIPRGGLVVAREVATALNADLDVVMAKKIGAPFNPEFAVAASDPDGKVVFPPEPSSRVSRSYILEQSAEVARDIQRNLASLREGRPEKTVEGRSVIVVDDGLATGLTAKAAFQYVRRRNPLHLYLAVPVAPQDTIEAIRPFVDDVICPLRPPVFYAVGEWYVSFDQVTDQEAREILSQFP
ncbi:MAG: phosphoribosyltransferase [Bacillota bacterium]|jgi:predicted phosphoribosyltransferase